MLVLNQGVKIQCEVKEKSIVKGYIGDFTVKIGKMRYPNCNFNCCLKLLDK